VRRSLGKLAYNQSLGNYRFAVPKGKMTRIKDRYGWIAKGRLAAMEVRRKHADAKATEVEPIVAEIRAAGVTTLNGIAKALNARGIPTVRGKTKWRRLGVRRVLTRLKAQGFAAPTSPSSKAAVDSSEPDLEKAAFRPHCFDGLT
jgi:hypothetical protein